MVSRGVTLGWEQKRGAQLWPGASSIPKPGAVPVEAEQGLVQPGGAELRGGIGCHGEKGRKQKMDRDQLGRKLAIKPSLSEETIKGNPGE